MPASSWLFPFSATYKPCCLVCCPPEFVIFGWRHARVNIVKRIKDNGRWIMRSIRKKPSCGWDWNSIPEGRYYVEWYENGVRKREPGRPITVGATQAAA